MIRIAFKYKLCKSRVKYVIILLSYCILNYLVYSHYTSHLQSLGCSYTYY